MKNLKKYKKIRAIIIAFIVILTILFILFSKLYKVQALSKYGSQGEEVKQIQTKLKRWGYYNGSIDGVFGSKTLFETFIHIYKITVSLLLLNIDFIKIKEM